MTHPLSEGTKELARRFRSERRVRSSLTAEQFLDRQSDGPAYPAGIARAQWVALLDVLRNALESEIDALVNEWLAQLPKLDPAAASSTLPLEEDAQATLAAPEVPAEEAQFIDRRYRIVRVLGEGAFGKVFLVKDKLQNDQELALKLIKKEHTATSEALVRFKNEILLLRVLNHPGIPQIFNDGISEDGEFYYTMAYVAGRTLDDVIRKEAPLDPLRIVRITKQILDVLDYAHARGAIHRDMKPGNIFLLHAGTPKEQVRVLDFGIAKVLSREGILEHAQTMNTEMPLGTPHYMSPEQVRGNEVDGRTDLYALGVIIYQMCSGRFPFTGKTLLEILSARLEKPPNPLEDATTPAWLRDVVMKLLEREREARPDTAQIRVMLDQLSGSHRDLSKKLTWIGAAVVVIAGVLAWSVFGKGTAKEGSKLVASAPGVEHPADVDHKSSPPQTPEKQGISAPSPNPAADGKKTETNASPTPAALNSGGKPETDTDGVGHPDRVEKFPHNPVLVSAADEIAEAAKAAAKSDASKTNSSEPEPPQAPKIPQGFTVASDATLDAQHRASSIVHEKTGIVLELVDAGPASFYLGRFEVTRDEWSRGPPALIKQVKLPAAPSGEKSERHPVVSVDFASAQDFCERLGLRLPTTDEWDHAAALAAGHVFPWGDDYVAGNCNCNDPADHFNQTAPVGSFPNDHCGPFCDMAGNVQEFCLESSGKPALRGGGWNSTPNACKLKGTSSTPPPRGSSSIGFRVALSCEP